MLAIYVGEHGPSEMFLRQKEKIAKELGVLFELRRYPATITTDELRNEVIKESDRVLIGGVIVQLPLPENIDRAKILNAIPPEKDIDCLSEVGLGRFFTGSSAVMPPVAGAVKTILESLEIANLEKKRAVVLGSGLLVGRPAAYWLLSKVPDVTVLRSAASIDRRKEALAGADIVVTGVGQTGLIREDMIKKDAVVIDFGYPADFEGANLDKLPFHITPTPGGTGPLVVAEVFRNLYLLNEPPLNLNG